MRLALFLLVMLSNGLFCDELEPCAISSAKILRSNPLTNFKKICVQSAIASPTLQKEMNEEVAKELAKIGQVEKLEINSRDIDRTIENIALGASAEGRLVISVENVLSINEKTLPIIETSIHFNTPTQLQKTESFSLVDAWNSHTFIEGNLSEKNRGQILSSVKINLDQFIEDYQMANPEQKEKPIFYLMIN